MIREPHRTAYIDKLYETKNIEWLEAEARSIRNIIIKTASDIIENLVPLETEKHTKQIEHEKEILKKIKWYILKLNNKTNEWK